MYAPAAAYRWDRSTDRRTQENTILPAQTCTIQLNRLEGPFLKLGQGGECQVH